MNKIKFFCVLASVILLLSFVGCSHSNSESSSVNDTTQTKEENKEINEEIIEITGVIKGKVIYENAGTDADFSGINVYLEKLEEENRSATLSTSALSGRAATAIYYASTITDTDGSYKFEKLPDGNYTVYAVNKDEAAVRSATIVEGGTITVEDLKLVLKGSLSGTLKVTGGDAAGSLVGVAGTSYIAFVDADGKFTISGIPAGNYKLCVMTNGKYQAFDTTYTVSGKTTANAGIISVTIESDSTESSNSGLKYVTVKNVADGIQFSGSIQGDGTWYGESQHSVIIYIKDLDNEIQMIQNWTKINPWVTWQLTYPLVDKGKEYNFTVSVADGNYTIYLEHFTLTAQGGLGEYKIENTEKYKTILTQEKILKKAVKAEYTNNPNITILREGILYDVYSGTKLWEPENYSLQSQLCLVDTANGSYDILNEGWQDKKVKAALLSGNNLCVWSVTRIWLAGFTCDGNAYFEMNDFAKDSFTWGGEKSKRIIAYGIRIRDSETYQEVEAVSAEEIEELLKNYELLNMPGDKARSFSRKQEYYDDKEGLVSNTITTEYVYTQLQDNICSFIEEPKIVPVLKSKDGTTKFRFTRWNATFPINGYSDFGTYENKDAFIMVIYANFEKIQ